MDKVRLGRALGYGTRHAARTLAAVAEAATAPAPQSAAGTISASASRPAPVPQAAPQPQVEPSRRVPSRAQVRGAGGALWKPLAAYSGALWLRVTGMFFAVIALALGNGAWRLRGQLRGQWPFGSPGSVPMQHFCFFLGFGLLFGYFAVSSFHRANRRERRG